MRSEPLEFPSSFASPLPAGTEDLRSVLVDYLARSRGVVATVDGIVVCGGVTHGLALLTDALCSLGRGRIAIDDPCVPVTAPSSPRTVATSCRSRWTTTARRSTP